MNLIDLALKRPATAIMIALAVALFGTIAFFQIDRDLFPKVNFAVVSVAIPYPGAAPEEVESAITTRVEEALSDLTDVKYIQSTVTEGFSFTAIQFNLEKDSDKALREVKDRIDKIKKDLPEKAEEPIAEKFEASALPILTYTAEGLPDEKLTDLLKDIIKPELQKIPGISKVNILGGYEREVHVVVRKAALEQYNLSVTDVERTLTGENLNFPSGRIESGDTELSLRTLAQSGTSSGLYQLLVYNKYGTGIPLNKIATVKEESKEHRVLGRINGHPALALTITKEGSGNMIRIASQVDSAFKSLQKSLPPSVKFTKIQDQSKFVREDSDATFEALLLGAILAVVVIFIFLKDWRATLVSGIAIPISLAGTFIFIQLMGFSFNMMTLMALALVVGILVDDAIVAMENIVRHMELGKSPFQAAHDGAKEILMAMTATTFTIVAVFTPIAFMKDIVGKFFREFGFTVSVSVLISLTVAAFLTPMMSAYLIKPRPEPEDKGLFAAIKRIYLKLLKRALTHPWITVAAALFFFVASFALAPLIPKEFMAAPDRGEFNVTVELEAEASLEKSLGIADGMTRILLNEPGVKTVSATIGSPSGYTGGGVNKSTLTVIMVPKEERKISMSQVKKMVRTELEKAYPGIKINVNDIGIIEESDTRPVQIIVSARNYSDLLKASDEMEKVMRAEPGLVDVGSSLKEEKQEYRFVLNRQKAMDAGVTAADAAMALRAATIGEKVSTLTYQQKEIDILVQMDKKDLRSPGDLEGVMLPTSTYGAVPLKAVGHIELGKSLPEIQRRDQQRIITLAANLKDIPLGTAVAALENKFKKLDIPGGVTYKFFGEGERMKDSQVSMMMALLVAVIVIYLVLVNQFESFLHPVTVMVSLPLAITGALLALLLTHTNLSLITMIGMVLLMGLVNKNAILLVDFALKGLREGKELTQTLMDASAVRIRPIFMTTAAMILGMLPIALGLGAGSEMRAPMAIAVIGGLITSTLLTLVVVPVVFSLMERLRIKLLRKKS